MDDKVYKATKKAKKQLSAHDQKIENLKTKQKQGEKLTFAERNILNVYNTNLKKAIKRSLK